MRKNRSRMVAEKEDAKMRRKTGDSKMLSKLFFRLLPIQVLLVAMGAINSIIDGAVAGRFISAETSPAMLWPMSVIYAVMVAGFAFGAVRGVQMIIIHAKNFNVRELSTIEQTMAEAAEEAAAGQKAEGGAN